MVAAVRTGADRFEKLIEKYDMGTTFESIGAILDHGEKTTRNAIRQVKEGDYTSAMLLDQDGNDDRILDEAVRLTVMVRIRADRVLIDFKGSNPQLKGPMNCPKPATISAARYGFKCITTPTLPNNEGCFRPMSVQVPEGTFLDPRYPAACALWPAPATSIPDLIIRATSEALPNRVWAGHFGDSFSTMIYGHNPKTRKWFISGWPNAGGFGGTAFWDGNSALHSMALGDTYNLPIEREEAKYPLMYERLELIRDSGGPGKHRGGLGARRDIRVLADVGLISTGDRSRHTPAWGLFGGIRGTPRGTPNVTVVLRKNGKEEVWHKVTNLTVKAGELFSTRPGGGGGYGNSFERDPQLVRADVINGYISLEGARDDYGVFIEQHTYEIDEGKTKSAREKTNVMPKAEVS